MNEHILTFKRILAEHNASCTAVRLATFELLIHAEPQTIPQLFAKATGRIDRVSLYRNIELFEKIGIVNRIAVGWKYKIELSDAFTNHHHHLICVRCGLVTDIKDEEHLDIFIKGIAKLSEFMPVRHMFEIEGYCENCKPTTNPSEMV